MIDIQDNLALAECCEEMNRQSLLAVDTEFIRERTYLPVLALIQVAWPGHEPLLIDPVPITDWSAFHTVLKNSDVCKIFHAGRQDLEIFYYQMGEVPSNIFDTQIASSMCGFGEQISYSALVAKLLEVQLVKSSSFTDWLQRPLTEAQLRYARDDVRYLVNLYETLSERAKSRHRLLNIREEIDRQLHAGLYEPDPKQLWRKVKKARSLKPRDLVVLQQLAEWRDQAARSANRPVRFIVADEVLVEISKIDRLTLENLGQRRGLYPRFISRYGQEMVDRHAAARQTPKDQWPSLKSADPPTSALSEDLADLAWILLKSIAGKAKMSPSNLILKRDLAPFIDACIIGGDLDSFPLQQGWRKELVGDAILNLIEGRVILKVVNKRLIWEEWQS